METNFIFLGFLILLFSAACGLICFFHLKSKKMEQQNLLLKEQYDQYTREYDLLKKRMDIFRKFRHDFNNHIQILDRLIRQPDVSSELKSYHTYFSEYADTLNRTGYCSHPVLAALLYDKVQQCEQHHISAQLHLEALYTEPFSDIDLAVLLFNLLDNAIESCLREEDTARRFLKMECQRSSGYLVFHLHNAKPDIPRKRTSKKNKVLHGLGLNIIKDIADKYAGDITTSEQDNWFKTSVWLKYNHPHNV